MSLTDSAHSDSSRIDGRETILSLSDRAIVRHEFIIAYEEPIESDYEPLSDPHRGYLTAWVQMGSGKRYERKQLMSGDDDMIREMFGEMASDGVERIEQFIGE